MTKKPFVTKENWKKSQQQYQLRFTFTMKKEFVRMRKQ